MTRVEHDRATVAGDSAKRRPVRRAGRHPPHVLGDPLHYAVKVSRYREKKVVSGSVARRLRGSPRPIDSDAPGARAPLGGRR